MRKSLTLLIFLFISVFSFAQTDSSYYAFLKMRDGTPVSGKVIASDITTITIVDFNIGQLTINKTQIVKETDIRVNSSYCFDYYSGQEYCGKVAASDSLITVATESVGEIKIDPRKVKEVRDIGNVANTSGQTWQANRIPFKYFMGTSAIPIKRRDKYFQATELDLMHMDFGISDHFSAGFGMVIPIFVGGQFKYSGMIAKDLYAGIGVAGGGSIFFGAGLGAVAGYGVITYGNEENNISAVAGWGKASFFGNNNFNHFNSSPTIGVHGMVRLGRKVSLISENYAFSTQQEIYHNSGYPNYIATYSYESHYTAVVSAGARIILSKGTLEAGIVYFPQADVWNGFGLAIPIVDYGIFF